jgi:hypothetical protein
LLAEWPDDRELTSEVLDSGDEVQLIGILDLLQRIETKEAFETVRIGMVLDGIVWYIIGCDGVVWDSMVWYRIW